MMRYRAPLALLLALSLATPSAALAQTKPKPTFVKRKAIRDELPVEARKNWEAARELFDAKDFGGALVEFTRVYDLSKNPRVLFNVGVCEKELKHYSKAVARWKQQLTAMSGQLSDAEEKDLNGAIAAVEQFVAAVEVASNEAGATLYIDNDEAGSTPFAAPVPIDVGRHTLVLRKATFADQSKDLNVASGKVEKVTFKLEPVSRKSLVAITATGAPTATVFIDGTDMGAAPFRGEVPIGRHTFEARSAGFVTARQTSEVVYKEPLTLALNLSGERHEGKIRVAVDPSDAIIEVDGKVVGSGKWDGVLASGGHQLVVRKPGYQTYSSDIALSDDQERSVNVPLQGEQRGAAWIWWSVGALAVIGGGVAASYAIFNPGDPARVSGTLPGSGSLVQTSHGLR